MGPLSLLGGGLPASIQGERQAAIERRRLLNQAMQRTSETQDKTTAQILQEAQALDPTKRLQALNDQAAAAEQGIGTDLSESGATDANGNAIIDTAGDSGAVSKEYLAAKADKALSEGARLTALAKAAARSRAPTQLTQEEAQRRAALLGEVGSEWSTAKNLNNANQLDAESVQLPWWGQVGKLATRVGAAIASGGSWGA